MKIWKRARKVVENSKMKSPSPAPSGKNPLIVPLAAIKKDLTDIDDAVFKDFHTKEGLVTVVYLSSLINPLVLHKAIILPLALK